MLAKHLLCYQSNLIKLMAPQCLKRGFQQNTETLWILYSHTNNVKKWAYAKSGIRDAGLKLGPTLGTQTQSIRETWKTRNPPNGTWDFVPLLYKRPETWESSNKKGNICTHLTFVFWHQINFFLTSFGLFLSSRYISLSKAEK